MPRNRRSAGELIRLDVRQGDERSKRSEKEQWGFTFGRFRKGKPLGKGRQFGGGRENAFGAKVCY